MAGVERWSCVAILLLLIPEAYRAGSLVVYSKCCFCAAESPQWEAVAFNKMILGRERQCQMNRCRAGCDLHIQMQRMCTLSLTLSRDAVWVNGKVSLPWKTYIKHASRPWQDIISPKQVKTFTYRTIPHSRVLYHIYKSCRQVGGKGG